MIWNITSFHQKKPDANVYVLHVGTNDIRSEDTPLEIGNKIIETALSLSTKENDVRYQGYVKEEMI